MDSRTLTLLSIVRNVARSLLIAFILSQENVVVGDDDPAELHAVNCKSVSRYMSQSGITYMKIAKVCECYRQNVQLETVDVTGCINDRLLADDTSAKKMAILKCNFRKKRSFALDFSLTDNQSKQWPLPIPYNISLSSPGASSTTQTIQSVISYIGGETCVRFSQTPAAQILSFQDGQGCLAYNGRSENPLSVIVLTSACYSFGEILSLVTTSLGLTDDSTRQDRGSYVYVNTSNIDPSNTVFLLPIPPYSYYGFPYDYASVVHSNPLRLTTNGQMTFRTLDPLYQNTIGQRVQLSFLDAKLINTIYCSGSCLGTTNTCTQGGYPDPNNCNLCKCPDGWSDRCQNVTSHDSGQCGQQFYDLSVTTSGTIQSPGYDSPGHYDRAANQQCTWLLTAPVGSHVKITFLPAFGFYQVNLACYHWVEVRYDGRLNETGPRFCGSAPLAQTMKSTGNQLMLLFRSFTSADKDYKGFKIQFEVDPCTTVWSAPMENTLTYGGTEVPGPVSQDGCLATCDITDWCYGVDIDNSSISTTKFPRCFMLRQSLTSVNYQAQGVTEYRVLNKCSTVTTTSTTTSPASTSSTPLTTSSTTTTSSSAAAATTAVTTAVAASSTTWTTTTANSGVGRCFTEQDGVQSSGASLVSSLHSVTDCLSHCLSVGCAGVDYVTSQNECWEYQDGGRLQQKYPNPVINQYTNICNTSATVTSITTSITTTSTTILPTQTSTTTSTSTSTPTSTTTSTTTPLTTTTATTTTATTSTTTTTTTRPSFTYGSTVCPTTTVRYPGVQSSGSSKIDSIATEGDCVNYCLASLSCAGVDVVTTNPAECWVYTDPSLLVTKYSNNQVIQYTFTRNCPSSVTTASPTTAVATTSSNGCQNSWQIYNNSHSVGATKTSTPLFLNDCLNTCAANTNCVAVDFNSAANPMECWMHTNPKNLNTRYAASDITQYVLNVRCPTSPGPNPGCGGANGTPGVLYPPCSSPTNPPSTCVKKVITFIFQGGCWTQRVDFVSVQCVILSCSGNARLASVEGGQQCVVPGWGPWSSCSASCGSYGYQIRYRYDICGSNNQYITVEQQQISCNTQVCPCMGSWGCSRCCSGFYERSGYCYRS